MTRDEIEALRVVAANTVSQTLAAIIKKAADELEVTLPKRQPWSELFDGVSFYGCGNARVNAIAMRIIEHVKLLRAPYGSSLTGYIDPELDALDDLQAMAKTIGSYGEDL